MRTVSLCLAIFDISLLCSVLLAHDVVWFGGFSVLRRSQLLEEAKATLA